MKRLIEKAVFLFDCWGFYIKLAFSIHVFLPNTKNIAKSLFFKYSQDIKNCKL